MSPQIAAPADSTLVNVKSSPYNAKGDGVTDDTTAIQAALTAAAGAYGGVVYVPAGTYITGPLTIPPGTVMRGVGGQAYYNATPTVPNVNNLTRLKLKAGSTGPMISPDDTGANSATGCKILDLNLDCNGINQPAINMPDHGSSISRFWLIQGVYVVNVNSANAASGFAVYIGNQNTGVTMRDCILFNGTSGVAAGYNGLGWYGSDNLCDNVFIGYFSAAGLTVLGGGSDEVFLWRGGGVFTCATGVAVGGGGVVFEGASFDHCQNDGVYISNGPVFFTNCTFHTNSMAGNGANSNIRVAGSNVTVTIVGCRAQLIDQGTNNPAYMIDVAGTGCTLNLYGNTNEGVSFVTGWTNYAGPGTTYNSALGSNTALLSDSALHTLVTSPSLPVGTYLVTATLTAEAASASSGYTDWGIAAGTATASIVGSSASVLSQPAASLEFLTLGSTVTCIVTVTVAGTLILRYQCSGDAVALSTGIVHNLGQSTGITAVAITVAV